MSYAAVGACPPTTYRRVDPPRDPCEIDYKVDMPIIGEQIVKVPLNQLVNDVRLQVDAAMPGIIENVWTQAKPKVDELVESIVQDIEYLGPDLTERIMKTVVLPKIEKQMNIGIAKAEAVRDEALLTLLATTGTILVGIGMAAWWIKKG